MKLKYTLVDVGVTSAIRSLLQFTKRSEARAIMRTGAKTIAMSVRAAAPKDDGRLKSSARWFLARSTKYLNAYAAMYISAKFNGGRGNRAGYSAIIAGGTGVRVIKKSKRPSLIGKRLGAIKANNYFARGALISPAVITSARNDLGRLAGTYISRSPRYARVISGAAGFIAR